MPLPYAESVNYYKTGRTAADKKLDQTSRLIEDVGGEIHMKMLGMMYGRSAVILGFTLDGVPHQIAWPILETKRGEKDTTAARLQAATFVYHDVKAKVVSYQVLGAAAFADIRMIESRNSTPRQALYDGDPADLDLLENKQNHVKRLEVIDG